MSAKADSTRIVQIKPMKDAFTPRQVARALGVSESTLKRWCDRGLLPTIRTAGGHRRIPIHGVLSFIRDNNQTLAHPELLGLPATSGQTVWVIERAREALKEALLTGQADICRQLILDLYLARQPISAIGDQLLAPVFEAIGQRWQHGETQVYQEHRACEIGLDVFYELRRLLPPPAPDAPLALGGTPEDDPHRLAAHLVGLVLCEAGWRVQVLGSSLSFETLTAAMRDHRPQLLWLSVSYIADPVAFLSGYRTLYEETLRTGTALVVGGRALCLDCRQQMQYAAFGDNLQHLDAFLATFSGRRDG
jgi:excisionase family DNA binding protein